MMFTWPSSACPAPAGFVGEFLVIVGALQVNFWLALLGAMGMILGAAYMLYLYRRVIFGGLTKADLRAHAGSLPARDGGVRAADPADAVDGRLSVELHAASGTRSVSGDGAASTQPRSTPRRQLAEDRH